MPTAKNILHEDEVPDLDLPGRRLRWLVNGGGIPAQHASMCVIRVAPGETVRPAHSHPDGEEVIYILSGAGRVMIEGKDERDVKAKANALADAIQAELGATGI